MIYLLKQHTSYKYKKQERHSINDPPVHHYTSGVTYSANFTAKLIV